MRVDSGLEVWHVDLSLSWCSRECLDLLDARERAQAARFRFAHLAEAYIVSHAALRSVLARWTGQAPQALAFEFNAHGQPRVAQAGAPSFSLSHTTGAALCAVAPAGEIGVDIEMHRPLAHRDLVDRFFSRTEQTHFGALPPEQHEAAFFSAWTRKEAYIKAKGLGLSLPLDSFSVEFRPDQAPGLSASEWASDDVGRFRLWDLPVRPGYRAALAYAGPASGPLRQRAWTPGLAVAAE